MSLDNKMEAIHYSATIARLGSPKSGYLGVRVAEVNKQQRFSQRWQLLPISCVCAYELWWTAVSALPVFFLTLKKKSKM